MTTQEYHRIVSQHSDDVYRFALRVCGDLEGAKDHLQEALASLWERHPSVEAAKGKSYLLSAVHHRAMDVFRREALAPKVQEALRHEESHSPHERFDLADLMERAMQGLPPVQRAALELCDVQGYSYREIAQILNLSDQQAGVYIHRARVSLRKMLIEYGYHA